MLLLQDHCSSGNQWGDCTSLIVSQWQNQQCCFYRPTDPLVISEVTVHVWLSQWQKQKCCFYRTTGPLVISEVTVHVDCLKVTKPTVLFLQDHWSCGNQWGDLTCLIVPQWQNQQCCFYRTTDPKVISEVTVHVWLSHSDKTNNVVLHDHWLSGDHWGDCTCLIVSQWHNLHCCFCKTTGPLVISEETVYVWLSHSDKTTMLLLPDHWSSDNQWGDCTYLIVSQWQILQSGFYRTNGLLVISEVTVHVWLSHSDKTNNVVFTGPQVLW